MPVTGLLRFAPLLLGEQPLAAGARALLGNLLEVPLQVRPNIGRWVPIPEDQRARLGRQAVRLGENFVVGERAFDTSGKFRVKVGPLPLARFEQFLPGGEDLPRLKAAVALATCARSAGELRSSRPIANLKGSYP